MCEKKRKICERKVKSWHVREFRGVLLQVFIHSQSAAVSKWVQKLSDFVILIYNSRSPSCADNKSLKSCKHHTASPTLC
jgi:hypothetical protein